MTADGPSIVVGVDGSRAGQRAAVWAIDEAVSRDIPLRLIAVAEGPDGTADAESAVDAAAGAVESAGRPVRVQATVVTGAPTLALLEASQTAAMVCVGAVGRRHARHQRLGSTAGALAASAHCPIAVVRGGAARAAGGPGWVVVEVDDTDDSAPVLQCAVEEARLRSAPLRVLGPGESRHPRLDRRLAEWRRRYPDLDVRPVAVPGGMLDYLARHSGDISLIVIGARNTGGLGELLGPTGQSALHDTDCSMLIVDAQRLL